MPVHYIRYEWRPGEHGAGFTGDSILPNAARKVPAVVLPIVSGNGVDIRQEGDELVVEFDHAHSTLTSGHFTTVVTGNAPSRTWGLQTFPTVRGSISGQVFTYKGVEYTIVEIDYGEFADAFDIDITPRIASADALDGLVFRFANSAGGTTDLAVSDARSIVDVTPNSIAGSQIQFTATDIWTDVINAGDWELLEPVGAHNFLPSSAGQDDGVVVTYNATSGAVEWRAPILPIPTARVGNTELFPRNKIPFRLTVVQEAELQLLLADLTIGGWEQFADSRISTNKATAYTNAQARAIADGGWTATRRAWTQGSFLSNQYIAIELDEQADFSQTSRWRMRFGDFALLDSDINVVAPADITAIGDNGLTGSAQRWFYSVRWNIPAGGARFQVEKDARSVLNNVTIPYENITGRPVGGQNAGLTSQQYIFVWRRASTTPLAPIGGVRDGDGWITLPTDWVSSPDLATGQPTDALYFSVTTDTRDAAGNHDIGVWSLPEAEGFNVQYSPVASPSTSQITATYQTTSPRSAYRRYLINGVWGPWTPLFVRPEYQQIVNYTLNIPPTADRTTEARTATFPGAIDLTSVNELWVELTVRRLNAPAIITRTQAILRPHDLVAVAANAQPTVWASSRDVLSYLRIVNNSSGEMRVWHGQGNPLALADGEVNAAGLMVAFIGTTTSARSLGIFRPASRNISYTIRMAVK